MYKFVLTCVQCGREHARFTLACASGCRSLLRARYREPDFKPKASEGLFRFIDWLPCSESAATSLGPVLYRCERFGRRLGLDRLCACFGGYWPEIGALNPTGTFKDFEALPTLLTFVDQGKRRLILASAGNTARAFAYAADATDVTVLIVVPQGMLERLWMPASHPRDHVRILAVEGSSDYYEAIGVAEEISQRYGIDSEGGAKNVARRDGLGTVMLEAARVLGRLPAHYFQAVGSGAGAIGVFEAVLRLQNDRRFADCAMPKLHLSQNAPFLPIHTAWSRHGSVDPETRWNHGGPPIYAGVLANRNPPYSIRGGVRDILEASTGETYAVTSAQAVVAADEFAADEGIDLDPAAAVALASLRQAVAAGRVRREESILLNLTGGGTERLRRDFEMRRLAPDLIVRRGDLAALGSVLDT